MSETSKPDETTNMLIYIPKDPMYGIYTYMNDWFLW